MFTKEGYLVCDPGPT